jgi:hypothetical protein
MARSERIGNYTIHFDEIYYLGYAGGKRELKAADQKEYDRTLGLPLILQISEQKKLGLDKNPNVIPLKGIQLLSFIRELGFVPFFDKNFHQSKLMTLTDLIIFESIKAKSYDMAMAQ